MNIIATRKMFLEPKNGGTAAVSSITIFEGYEVDNGENYCMKADFFGEKVEVFGIDKLQALSLMFFKIGKLYKEKREDCRIYLENHRDVEMETFDEMTENLSDLGCGTSNHSG